MWKRSKVVGMGAKGSTTNAAKENEPKLRVQLVQRALMSLALTAFNAELAIESAQGVI